MLCVLNLGIVDVVYGGMTIVEEIRDCGRDIEIVGEIQRLW